jgi:hypothetical protein
MSNREALLEIIWIIKTCLTTFWFWVPFFIGLIPLFTLWIILTINPMAAFALPAIVAVGALRIDDKRTKASLQKGKGDQAVHPVGTGSEFLANWDAREKIKEYLKTLDKKSSSRSLVIEAAVLFDEKEKKIEKHDK